MPPKTTQRPKSLIATVKSLSKTPQLYWFLAHVLSLVNFAGSFIFGLFSPVKALSYYRYTFFFQLISYGIVIKQVHFSSSAGSRSQLLRDENVQYFLFAFILWLVSFKIGTLAGTPYSYIIFLFFHVATYLQSHLLESLPIPIATQAAISSRITYLTTNFTQQSLYLAATSEVMMVVNILWQIPRLVINLFRDQVFAAVHVFSIVAVIVFVKLRYNENQTMKLVVQQLDAKAAGFLSNPMLPPQLLVFYQTTFKQFVAKYISPIKVPTRSVQKKTE